MSSTVTSFTPAQKNQVVGHIHLIRDLHEDDTFECAAWYRTHELPAGTYPVTLIEYPYGGWKLILADVPTVITAAYFGTLFGGVAVGKDQTGPREIGRQSTHTFCLMYTHRGPEELDLSMYRDGTFTPV